MNSATSAVEASVAVKLVARKFIVGAIHVDWGSDQVRPFGHNFVAASMQRPSLQRQGNTISKVMSFKTAIGSVRPECVDTMTLATDDLYDFEVLQLAATIERVGRLDQADGPLTAESRVCGSRVTVDVCLDGERISDFAHVVEACALGQAAAAVIARHAVGLTPADVAEGRARWNHSFVIGRPVPAGTGRT